MNTNARYGVDMTPLVGQKDDPKEYGVHKTFSYKAGYALCVNYIIGTGVFGLPYGFRSAGAILSCICMAISSFTAFVTVHYVLEVLARAEGVVSAEENRGEEMEKFKEKPVHQLTWRKFEFTAMSEVFGGLRGKIFSQLVVSLYCYGVMWAYTSVFASSLANIFNTYALDKDCDIYGSVVTHECQVSYYLCVLVYAAIVIPLTLVDVGEQIYFQVFLTCARFSAFIVMIVSVSFAMIKKNGDYSDSFPLFQWGGFASAFTTIAVALNCHQNLPNIYQPIVEKDKLKIMSFAALGTSIGFYTLIAVLCSYHFRGKTEQLVTLNWKNYSACGDGWDDCPRSAVAIIIRLWVMCFPVVDVATVFPLLGITLANNLLELVPARTSERFNPKLLKFGSRLIATIPPLCLGAGLGKLDTIFNIVGLFAFFLELIIPCVLHLISKGYCEGRWGPTGARTTYTSWMSIKWVAYGVLVYGVIAFLFSTITIIVPNLF